MADGRLARTRVGVLGSGEVGRRLAAGFASRGHDVRIGWPIRKPESRNGYPARSRDRIRRIRRGCRSRRVARPGGAGQRRRADDRRRRPRQLQGQGGDRYDEPARLLERLPAKLSISGEDSLGERVQRALPDAKVVKAFNTIGNPYFVDPSFSQGKPTMLIAGDDEGAKRTVGDVLADFGWPDLVDSAASRARASSRRSASFGSSRRRTRRLGPRVCAARRLTHPRLRASNRPVDELGGLR